MGEVCKLKRGDVDVGLLLATSCLKATATINLLGSEHPCSMNHSILNVSVVIPSMPSGTRDVPPPGTGCSAIGLRDLAGPYSRGINNMWSRQTIRKRHLEPSHGVFAAPFQTTFALSPGTNPHHHPRAYYPELSAPPSNLPWPAIRSSFSRPPQSPG